MPEQSTRIVVLGAPKADKEFDLFVGDRDAVERDVEEGRKDLEQVERELNRIGRSTLRRGRG